MKKITVLLILTAFCCNSAFSQSGSRKGLDPGKSLSQYIVNIWTTDQGLPQNSVQSVIQSKNGYLWIGTQEGLVRFDGIVFTVFDKSNTPGIKNNYITSLANGSDGSIWIGSNGGGITQFKDGKFTSYSTENGLVNDFVNTLISDSKGNIWIGTNGGLVRFSSGKFTSFTRSSGLKDEVINSVEEDASGNIIFGTNGGGLGVYNHSSFRFYSSADGLVSDAVLKVYKDKHNIIWIGCNGGLSKFQNGSFTNYTEANGLPDKIIQSVFEESNGSLWIATGGNSFARLKNGQWEVFGQKGSGSIKSVFCIFEDIEGSLWIGTNGSGLVRLKNTRFTNYSVTEGLPSNFVWSVFEDKDYNIWTATGDGGVGRMKDGRVNAVFSEKDGLGTNDVKPMMQDNQGNIWFGTSNSGISILKNGKFTHLTMKDGLGSDHIRTLFKDSRGDVWIGGSGGGLFKYSDGNLTQFGLKDGLVNEFPRTITEDNKGNIWIGTNGGISVFSNGRFTSYTKKDGLSSELIRSLYSDRDGIIWIGTSGGGLIRYKQGRFFSFGAKDGLLTDLVFTTLEDNNGFLWMSCNKGILRVSKQELNDFADGKIKTINAINYGKADGMVSTECNGGAFPSAVKSHDGKLWFPTMGGVIMIDPGYLLKNEVKPPVVIEQIIADDKPIELSGEIELKAGTGQIEFRYTGLSLFYPQGVKFKYKLEGFDDDWIDAGTRRTAFYTNLSPGSYKFRVMACNNDGLWNETGTEMEFYLRPYFYQTYWFYAICILAVAYLAFRIYNWRIMKMKENEARLNKKIDEMVLGLKEANQKITEEKAGVEQKVEEAVKESEAERIYLTTNVEKMLKGMDRFAEGDLTVKLNVERNDDISKLFTGFNRVIGNIHHMIIRLQEAVNATASASTEISTGTEQMAANSRSQVLQINEAKAAVSEIAHTIHDTSKNLEQASAMAKNAGQNAKNGGVIVEDTIKGMIRISDVVSQSALTVKELGRGSEQIGEIIQVINGIADQTNLLALNAAIEAARAGEQGRGFAVVADEVRKLAERTAKATKEIETMIKKIQTDTANAVKVMNKGQDEVESGKQMAGKAGAALKEIIDSTDKVTDIIVQVAAASEEQSAKTEIINRNMEIISDSTQENSAGVAQIARASEDLSRLAVNLQHLAGQFKVQQNEKELTPEKETTYKKEITPALV